MSRVIFTEELISGFHEKIIKEYPDITLKEVNMVVRAEFKRMKDKISSGDLEDYRLQYLFNIRVSPQKIIKQLSFMYRKVDDIDSDTYRHYLVMMLNHVRKNPTKFKKYYERIEKYTGYSEGQINKGEFLD